MADTENEERLALAALHLSASATERLCRDFRHARSPDAKTDDELALEAFEKRSLTWRALNEHSMVLRLRLPTDQPAELIAVIELFEQTLMESTDAVDVASNADVSKSRLPDISSDDYGIAETPGTFIVVPKITTRQRRVDAIREGVRRDLLAGYDAHTARI